MIVSASNRPVGAVRSRIGELLSCALRAAVIFGIIVSGSQLGIAAGNSCCYSQVENWGAALVHPARDRNIWLVSGSQLESQLEKLLVKTLEF